MYKYEKKRGNLLAPATVSDFSQAYTAIVGRVAELATGNSAGTVNVTYYCQFMKPRINLVDPNPGQV